MSGTGMQCALQCTKILHVRDSAALRGGREVMFLRAQSRLEMLQPCDLRVSSSDSKCVAGWIRKVLHVAVFCSKSDRFRAKKCPRVCLGHFRQSGYDRLSKP